MKPAEMVRLAPCVVLAIVACGESTGPGDGIPARLDPVGGNGQSGVVGQPLPELLVVRVTDRSGAAIPDVGVVFVVTSGGGSVAAAGTTDGAGQAGATWTLGPTSGEQTVEVRLPASESVPPIVFGATATPSEPVAFDIAAGNEQSRAVGQALRDSLSVRITDAFGNGVPDLRVDFQVASGGGRVSPASSTTAADGRARTQLTLGANPGVNLVIARTADFDSIGLTALAYPAPVVTAVTPETLVPGESVLLTGTDFARMAGDTELRVAGQPADIIEATPERIEAIVPCVPSGTATVSLTTSGVRNDQSRAVSVSPTLRLDPGRSEVIQGPRPGCAEIASPGSYLILVTRATSAPAPSVRIRGQQGGPAAQAATPTEVAHVNRLSTRAVLHDRILASAQAVLERGNSPARAQLAEDPEPGDTVLLTVPDVAVNPCTVRGDVRGRVVTRGARSLILEDVASPLAGEADSVIAALQSELEDVVIPLLEENFGDALTTFWGGDGPRLRLLLTPMVNQLPGITGFTSVGDLLDPATCAASNNLPVFYGFVPTNPTPGYGNGIVLTRANWLRLVRASVVHETKHLIAFASRVGAGVDHLEERWLEEGTAMVAEELYARGVFGYGPEDNVSFRASLFCERRPDSAAFPECRDKPLVMLNHFTYLARYLGALETRSIFSSPAGDNSYYGAAWSLLRWVLDYHAPDEPGFLRAMTTDTERRGPANLEERTGRSFDRLFAEWMMALALDDRAGFTPAAPRQSFPGWDLRDIYAGLQQELPLLFPRAYPLAPRSTPPGAFDIRVTNLPGGSSVLLELGALSSARQLIDATVTGEGVTQVNVVRLN